MTKAWNENAKDQTLQILDCQERKNRAVVWHG